MHIRTKGRLFGLAFLAATSLMAEAGPAPSPQTPGAIAHALRDAPTKARESVPAFIAHAFDATGQPHPGARIKYTYQHLDGSSSDDWTQAFELQGKRILLFTSPGQRPEPLALGDLQDWSLTGPDGRLFGAFTTRAAADLMPRDAARAMQALLTDSPCPGPCVTGPHFSP